MNTQNEVFCLFQKASVFRRIDHFISMCSVYFIDLQKKWWGFVYLIAYKSQPLFARGVFHFWNELYNGTVGQISLLVFEIRKIRCRKGFNLYFWGVFSRRVLSPFSRRFWDHRIYHQTQWGVAKASSLPLLAYYIYVKYKTTERYKSRSFHRNLILIFSWS